MNTNTGYKFYKEYFKDLKIKAHTGKPEFDGKTISEELFTINLNNYLRQNSSYCINTAGGSCSFSLTTVYPGLLIGSGYIHEIGGVKDNNNQLVENELKLGFFFDYTTGLPVIPGSSVKGVLRSAFDKDGGDYVKELLVELKITGAKNIDIKELKNNIFEGDEKTSVYQRDKFFDAFPVKSNNRDGRFLGDDFITPHKDPLKNPVPLRFLKVLPGVTFNFNFQLHDFKDDNGKAILTADNKLELFKKILLDLGIGAKTNVGYGQFTGYSQNSNSSHRNSNNSHTQNSSNNQQLPGSSNNK